MSVKIFIFLLGFGLTIIGFSYIIIYLNLISLGYNFFDYVNFISRRVECINALIGIILMLIALIRKDDKDELYV